MAPEVVLPKVVGASANPAAPTKPAPTWSRAYVTFVAGKGDSVQGVVGLVKGLRKVKSTYPLVVAVLPDVPVDHQRILKEQGCRVRKIKPVCPQGNQTPFAMADYFINYSKLGVWEFVQYSKMVYLDGSIQDGHFYAVLDCFCERTWSHTPQYAIGYCQQCPDKVQWRDDMGPPPSPYFDDSMFVFEPNLTAYNDLLNTLRTTPPTPFAQQDFLNMYFRHIYKPLPLEYNLPLSMLWHHPEKVDLEEVKVVHYCEAGSKPWMYTWQENTGNMQREGIKIWVKKWWDIYEDKALDYKNWIWRPRKRPGVSTGNLASGPNKRSAM
ncbi:hypothetical protein EUGRSUZ_H00902 [Eucalyptus grandis]|uniref:Uncharacterized protein n=2 Tax=Eucalyptus grandis TaxID=71139 RepID=A0ACC3JNZ9_EUCGR|nr:hypothetical protein EUGRSUZ_H00902 [Eucalyptus grandis]